MFKIITDVLMDIIGAFMDIIGVFKPRRRWF
jgi:hypothetical protein